MSKTWSHPVLTKGLDVPVEEYTVGASIALAELEAQLLKDDVPSMVANQKLAALAAYHTLKPHAPDVTPEAVLANLKVSELLHLWGMIAEANAMKPAKKADADFPA